jgi:PKD repeat protein
MKNRFFTVILLLVLLVTLTGNAQATSPASTDRQALVYVNLESSDDLNRFASTQLPMYAMLDGGLLTGANRAGQQTLLDVGLSYQVLDPDLRTGKYYLAETRSSRTAPDFASSGQVLRSTDNGVLLRMDPSRVDALTQAGAELRLITLTPKPLPKAQSDDVFPEVVDPDPIIQGMIYQVTETEVYTYDRQLAGELPVWVDDGWYTIPTRYTYSGTPIQKTTNYVGQHMENLGLDVEYHTWEGVTYPNVIGEIPGMTNPDDIFIIGGHIDDVQGAPGADDNASGSVATLLAADILSHYQWGCTLRFAFWTGEEEGLLGSAAYAARAHNTGENILGYLNLDMIAWNTIGSDPYINLFYSSSLPPTQELAQLYADVIDAYNLDLLTRFGVDLWGSDHNSFWDYGFTSILAIEDDIGNDFNPYYHSPGDTPAHTDPAYFTDFVKASIATYAHMSGCLIPPGQGALDGHVIAANGGAPLEGATVTADDGQGNTYPVTTDASGYYTMTLPTDTYTVTATQPGYIPQSQSATIVGGLVTTLDFALQPICEPVTGLDFTWVPLEPFNGNLTTFTATAIGTMPIDFLWDFGDGITTTGEIVTYAYEDAGTYLVVLSATNTCGTDDVSKDITVLEKMWEFFLPLVGK